MAWPLFAMNGPFCGHIEEVQQCPPNPRGLLAWGRWHADADMPTSQCWHPFECRDAGTRWEATGPPRSGAGVGVGMC